MRENNIVVNRLSSIFYGTFKVFLTLNGIILLLSIYNMCGSSITGLRTNFWITCILIINFWVMMVFFFLLSLCFKFIFLLIEQNHEGENRSLLNSILLFPLIGDDEEILQTILQESTNTEQASRASPTSDKLISINLKWGFCMETKAVVENDDNKCLICTNNLSHNFPEFQGCVSLQCNCDTIFHKKCILEWFHFNETDTDTPVVTCPSCRHAFTLLENMQ